MPRNDAYGSAAFLYDTYVCVDIDIQFFKKHGAARTGPVLELMAGTGRVSVELIKVNARLTCVDSSPGMLRVLQGKFAGVHPAPQVVCADVRALPLECRYELAVIPFNSFAELTATADQRHTLSELWRVLLPGGQLICTLHNPTVRKRTLDGQTRLLGTYALGAERQLELWVKGSIEPVSGLAHSEQTYRIYDAKRQLVDERYQQVRFALLERHEFEAMARASGFRILSLVGDYEATDYREDSPFMIWLLEKLPEAVSRPVLPFS
jgi:ubiquinone/menaquinone biosynthesis C-methylase UbiE